MSDFGDLDNVYWERPMRDMILEQDLSADVSKHPEEPWMFRADLSDSRIHIYFEGDAYSYSLTPTSGPHAGEEGRRNKVPGDVRFAKLAAINCLRRYCTSCEDEVTFTFQVTTWMADLNDPGKPGTVTDITCKTCDDLRHVYKFQDTGVINRHSLMAAISEHQLQGFRVNDKARGEEPRWRDFPHPQLLPVLDEIYEATQRITEVVKDFEQQVWFGGLQSFVQGSNYATWSGDLGDGNDVLALSSAGRFKMTFRRPDDNVFLDILADESRSTPSMGISSIEGTEDQVIGLLKAAIALGGSLNLKYNPEVNPFG